MEIWHQLTNQISIQVIFIHFTFFHQSNQNGSVWCEPNMTKLSMPIDGRSRNNNFFKDFIRTGINDQYFGRIRIHYHL